MSRSPHVAGCLLLIALLTAWIAPLRAQEGAGDLAAALDEGQNHLARGEAGLAVDSFRRAVRLSEEKSFAAWSGLTTALTREKRYADAVEAAHQAQAAATTPEKRSTAASLLASALLASDDFASAIPVLREIAAAPGPQQKHARQNLVGALLLADRRDEAAEVLRSYRAAGAPAGEVQGLLCGAGGVLNAHLGPRKDKVNELLRALDPNAPLQAGGEVLAPKVLKHDQPAYTEEARRARLQGTVILNAVLDAQGRVNDADVLKGLPMGLTESAIEMVKQWTFQPATLNGAPVPVCYLLTVNFQIQVGKKEKDQGGAPKPEGAHP